MTIDERRARRRRGKPHVATLDGLHVLRCRDEDAYEIRIATSGAGLDERVTVPIRVADWPRSRVGCITVPTEAFSWPPSDLLTYIAKQIDAALEEVDP